jgi:5-methylcytosine-specific restriction protein A
MRVLDNRESTTERGYDADWKRLRATFLVVHPICEHCDRRGVTTPARVVNHRIDIRDRPDLRLNESNLEALCKQCHDRHTARRMNAERKRLKEQRR